MAKAVTTTFTTWLDLTAAIERLGQVLDGLQVEADAANRSSDSDLAMRVRRHGAQRATVWMGEDDVETAFTVTLAGSPGAVDTAGTTVTVESDPITWKGRPIPGVVTRRLAPIDPAAAIVQEWFDPAFDPSEERGADAVLRLVGHGTHPDRLPPLYRKVGLDWDDPVDPTARALRADALVAVEAPAAIDAPGVRQAVRRRRRLAASLFALALACTGVSVGFGVRGAQREHRLEMDGIDATATVVEVPHGDSDDLVVRYDTPAGAERYSYFDPEFDYDVGDLVEVRYVQGEELVAVGDEFFYDAPTTDPSVIAAFGALVLWPCAVRTAVRARVMRRVLEGGPFRIASVMDQTIDKRALVLRAHLVDGDRNEVVKIRRPRLPPLTGVARWGIASRFGRVLVAGDRPRRRIAMVDSGRPYFVVTSRIPLRRRWWAWRIEHDW